jgi:hypothetical protein
MGKRQTYCLLVKIEQTIIGFWDLNFGFNLWLAKSCHAAVSQLALQFGVEYETH